METSNVTSVPWLYVALTLVRQARQASKPKVSREAVVQLERAAPPKTFGPRFAYCAQ